MKHDISSMSTVLFDCMKYFRVICGSSDVAETETN